MCILISFAEGEGVGNLGWGRIIEGVGIVREGAGKLVGPFGGIFGTFWQNIWYLFGGIFGLNYCDI